MTQKKKWFFISVAITVMACLIAMIVVTAVLSDTKSQDWEYHTYTEGDNYSIGDFSDADFAYINNFKKQFSNYFGVLINDKLSTYVNLESNLEQYLSGIAEKIVDSMLAAGVSPIKLNVIAECLKDNSVENIFSILKNAIGTIGNLEEYLENLQNSFQEISALSAIGKAISGMFKATTLTENDFARFLYHYLVKNGKAEYTAYLFLMGEDYFVSFVSNSLYVIMNSGNLTPGSYNLKATANSLRSVLYQLGSMYTGIAGLPGGVETLERVFYLTWDFKDDELSALNDSIKGKIGEMFIKLGWFLRGIKSDEIEAVYEYNASDEEKKDVLKIYASELLAKSFTDSFFAEGSAFAKYDTVGDFFQDYLFLLDTLSQMNERLFELMGTDTEQTTLEETDTEDASAMFSSYASAFAELSEASLSLKAIEEMDKNSKEYLALKDKSEMIFNIKESFVTLIIDVANIWISKKLYSIIEVAHA